MPCIVYVILLINALYFVFKYVYSILGNVLSEVIWNSTFIINTGDKTISCILWEMFSPNGSLQQHTWTHTSNNLGKKQLKRNDNLGL